MPDRTNIWGKANVTGDERWSKICNGYSVGLNSDEGVGLPILPVYFQLVLLTDTPRGIFCRPAANKFLLAKESTISHHNHERRRPQLVGTRALRS